MGQLALNIKLRNKNKEDTKTKRRNINVKGSANGNPNFAPMNAELQSSTKNIGATLVKLLAIIYVGYL